jgi:transcriptional regulator with XRE-family HTH domain
MGTPGIGKRLRAWRESQGLSHEHVAAACGCHSITVQRWEDGERGPCAADIDKLNIQYPGALKSIFQGNLK